MLKIDRVTLVNKAIGTQDEFGGYVAGKEISKDIWCDFQPYSRELLLKRYGFDIEVTKLMICDIDKDIKEGSIVLFNDISYEVKKIPWDRGHIECVLNGI